MTDVIAALDDEWRECMRVMWSDEASQDEFWEAYERAKELEQQIRVAEQQKSEP